MFRDKLKSLMKSPEENEGTDKKKIENLVFFVIVLIITIIIINTIWNGNKNKNTKTNTNDTSKQLATSTSSEAKIDKQPTNDLEEKLESILDRKSVV